MDKLCVPCSFSYIVLKIYSLQTTASRTAPRRLTVRWIDLKAHLSQPAPDPERRSAFDGARDRTAKTRKGSQTKGASHSEDSAQRSREKATDGHEADDESDPSCSDSELPENDHNEVAEKEAIEELKRRAKFGSLAVENRGEFSVSDIFNLDSPLLQELLGDAPVLVGAQAQPVDSGSGNHLVPMIAQQARALPPSKAAWGVWKRPQL